MSIIDDIYANVDDFGLITSSEAKGLGITNAEVAQQARRGKLIRVARGVYRMPIWPYQEAAPYAIAVRAAGASSYLYGESVIALLGLASTDPAHIWVASPERVRRSIGESVTVLRTASGAPTTHYEGIPCQPVAEAIRTALPRMGRDRAREATEAARREGYITDGELDELRRELS